MTPYERSLARLIATPTLPKFGLARMAALCDALGRPQDRFASLHIAGTKGKGSTAAMTAAIMREAGFRTGLTTSPHLLCARERIIINDELIDEPTFASLEERVARAAVSLDPALEVPSFFERMIAMAFCAFADAKVDVAVIETGLGGRLDATNIIKPLACAITRIGYDHMEFLGHTLEQIAAEKAGIIKPGVPVATAKQDGDAMAVIKEVAQRTGGLLNIAEDHPSPSLLGLHQEENAGVAALLAWSSGLVAATGPIERGLATVRFPGRYEIVCDDPLVLIDGAHDPLAMAALVRTLAHDPNMQRPLHLVIGASRGHDVSGLYKPLRGLDWVSVTSTQAVHPRAVSALDVARGARMGVVDVEARVEDAVAVAASRARADGGAVIVTGSLFVVGEARGVFIDMPRDPVRPGY